MKLYNDLTRQKEELKPLSPGLFKVYVCGPTVYNYFHLGNARAFITGDILRRYLEYRGNEVDYVQNFTDIEDKIILGAKAKGISTEELCEQMIEAYFEDADGLKIKRATAYPRATKSMGAIISLVKTLMDKGHAYLAEDGVYFEVASFPNYGRLSKNTIEDLEAGASMRVDTVAGKKSPLDFVLWKLLPGEEPVWDSPWGQGRPGWHIECSAMIHEHFNSTIDIHLGGQDLIFPHHENEIAQSEAATGEEFVRYWIHNGFININNEKMSKSKNNFFLIRDLARLYDYSVLRYFIVQAHYRMPLNYSPDLLDASKSSLERIKNCVKSLDFAYKKLEVKQEASKEAQDLIDLTKSKFIAAMNDDLNTADALAAIFELVRLMNHKLADEDYLAGDLKIAQELILELMKVLGFDLDDTVAIPDQVMALVEARTKAKQERQYQEADSLRDQIQALGYRVEDTAQGPKVLMEK